ncbi:GNAT family N-acetyltransferase [bacterium AH-315-P07]|nr:GNAT family N-acetyltransferase [bacterium AH-315-P07]
MKLRCVRKDDTQAVIDLIGEIYSEYGFEICLEDAESDLTSITDHYPQDSFMVLVDDDGAIRATVALTACPEQKHIAWLKRLYLDSSLRGGGHAERLLSWAVDRARLLGLTRMELWSDIRFDRAHRFYEKHGFARNGTVRHMTDAHEPYDEYFFARDLMDLGSR